MASCHFSFKVNQIRLFNSISQQAPSDILDRALINTEMSYCYDCVTDTCET